MKAAELRSKTVAELKKTLIELRKESFNLRLQRASGQVENLSRAKVVKKDIARVKTIITELIKIDSLGSKI